MYTYYGADTCSLKLTDRQKELLGFTDKTDKELGIGEYCLTPEKIYNYFKQQGKNIPEEGITR